MHENKTTLRTKHALSKSASKSDACAIEKSTSSQNVHAEDFMRLAILEAQKAFKKGEVPIGAVLVRGGKVIAKAHNMREKKQNALLHAEVICINKACSRLGSWRLDDCEMFVTLEPCPMCAGAIQNARLSRVTFACEEKTSSDHLCQKILQSPRLNHTCTLVHDRTFEAEAATLLSDFFKLRR